MDCLRTEYNVPGCLVNWLASYFDNRSQAVKIGTELSSWRPVKAGVVQGFFMAYFDGVMRGQSHGAVSVKYADDLLILHPFNNDNDGVCLQKEIDCVVGRMGAKNLSINSEKCGCTVFTESTAPYLPQWPLRVLNQPVTQAPTLGYLGVTMDSKLSWTDNSRAKVVKAKQAVGSLRRLLKNKQPSEQLSMLYSAKVLPIFSYGIIAT